MQIELQDIRKAFNQGQPNEFWAIQGVSLMLEPNRVTCLNRQMLSEPKVRR